MDVSNGFMEMAKNNSHRRQQGRLLGNGEILKISGILAILITLGAGNLVSAQSVTFTGSQAASNLAASVTFTMLNSTNLQITLTDTYTGDTPDQGHVLTGVFFSGATGLTPLSATAAAGSVEWTGKNYSNPQGSSILGTEWAYATASGAPGGAASGIVSSGYWSPGHGNFAPGGDMLDGTPYGLLSAGYAGSDKGGLKNDPFIQDSMVFVLSGFTGSLSAISDVSFQYGSALTMPNLIGTPLNITPVPEPTVSANAAVVAVMLLSWAGWRKGSAALKNKALKWGTREDQSQSASNRH